MAHSTLTTPQDAHRMAYAAYCDGYDDAWHGAYARAHGDEINSLILSIWKDATIQFKLTT